MGERTVVSYYKVEYCVLKFSKASRKNRLNLGAPNEGTRFISKNNILTITGRGWSKMAGRTVASGEPNKVKIVRILKIPKIE